MKKALLIVLWSFGILYGALWIIGGIYGMIHLHRFSLRPLLFISFNAWLGYISFRYLREELGGPIVEFDAEELLSREHERKLRSLWK